MSIFPKSQKSTLQAYVVGYCLQATHPPKSRGGPLPPSPPPKSRGGLQSVKPVKDNKIKISLTPLHIQQITKKNKKQNFLEYKFSDYILYHYTLTFNTLNNVF